MYFCSLFYYQNPHQPPPLAPSPSTTTKNKKRREKCNEKYVFLILICGYKYYILIVCYLISHLFPTPPLIPNLLKYFIVIRF